MPRRASAKGGPFFIHFSDPGFPEPPWPNERRIGPFDTDKDALAQAISDAAGGYGVAVGVYNEVESLKRVNSTARSVGKAEHTATTIRNKGEVRARAIQKERADAFESDAHALASVLPPGMGMEEAAEILLAHRDTVSESLARALASEES